MPCVDDEHRPGKLRKGDETTEAGEELLDLAVDKQTLALGVLAKLAALALTHELLKAVDTLPDVLEIGEGPADPTTRDVRRSRLYGRRFYDLGRFVLATDEIGRA